MSGVKPVRVEGRVRDVVQSGDAVVETERGIVFARGALRGEQIVVSLDPKPGKGARGRLVTVLSPAPARVETVCPHALRCGGCPLMHASLAEQRSLRLGFLRSALARLGGELPSIRETWAEQVLAYRRRARLAFAAGKGARKLGYRRERSHELSDIAHCSVLHPTLDTALQRVRAQLLPLLSGEGELSLALGEQGRAVLVVRAKEAQAPALYTACGALLEAREPAEPQFAGVALFAAGATKPALFGSATEWSLGFDEKPLEGALGGFSQAHAEVNQKLVQRVRALIAPGQKLLELFAGHGNFSVALAPDASLYTAVEQDAQAVAALRRNLTARGASAKLVEGDALAYGVPSGIDAALLDPPRSGAPGALARLGQRKIKRIVYVSCDPETLARDLGEVVGKGYRLASVELFEMFPQTADLETLVCLDRE